jgi:hypothetical protein
MPSLGYFVNINSHFLDKSDPELPCMMPYCCFLLLQCWLKNGGYTGGPAVEVDLSVSTPQLMGTLVRFITWYAAGRPGDPIKPAKPTKARSGGSKVCGHGAQKRAVCWLYLLVAACSLMCNCWWQAAADNPAILAVCSSYGA